MKEQEIKSLFTEAKSIQAPYGFTDSVMQHIEEISVKQGSMQFSVDPLSLGIAVIAALVSLASILYPDLFITSSILMGIYTLTAGVFIIQYGLK